MDKPDPYSYDHHRWLLDLHRRLVAGEVEDVEKRLRLHLAQMSWLRGELYPA